MLLRKPETFPLAVLLMLLILSAACTSSSSDGPTPVLSAPPTTTFPMPPTRASSIAELGWVSMPAGSGKDVSRAKIRDYRGKVLVLDMYATWCAPCRQSIPQLVQLQRRYQQKGLEIVGLNVGGPDDRIKVAQFAQELGINYSLGFPDRELTDLLMSDDSSIPQTFVFSRDGTLVQRFTGYSEEAVNKLEHLIQAQTAADVQ